MQLEELFANVKSKWPPQIDLADAELVGSSGFLSWNLVRAEEEAEAKACDEIELVKAAIWPFHQALHCHARKQFILGEAMVSRDNVALEIFAHYLRKALREPSWSAEREAFTRANPTFWSGLSGSGGIH